MKTIALMTALLVSSAAVAQTTSSQGTMDHSAMGHGTTSQSTTTTQNTNRTAGQNASTAGQSTTSQGSMGSMGSMDHNAMGHGTMAQGSMNHQMGSDMMASSQVVQPSNANPEHDARGIAVISAPAVVPAGWNGTSGAAMGGPLEGAENEYPACSATITDNCVQAYERGHAH